MGRKAFDFTPEKIKMIEQMSAVGLADYLMAGVLGISTRTFEKYKAKMPEIKAAIEKGRGVAAFTVGKSLFNEAKSGVVPAIKWFEASRLGYTEKQQVENTVKVATPEEEQAELDELQRVLREHGIGPN